jgi:uncharacterized protein
MDGHLKTIFDRLHGTADFADVDFSDVNACSIDGDNALHCIVRWGDIEAARALIDASIDVNKAGDLGYTPLHVACMKGNIGMVQLLLQHGADPFAMSEGDIPLATARLSGYDQICEILAVSMNEKQAADPKIWIRARIAQLRREIANLERKL